MINFIFNNTEDEEIYFNDVEEDGFFIDVEGFLCQKVEVGRYNIIAKPNGVPYAGTVSDVSEDEYIKKILGCPSKIDF